MSNTPNSFDYKIGDKKYFQYRLVAGQKLEILRIIKELLLNNIDPVTKTPNIELASVVNQLTGDLLARFIGVVLVREDEKVADFARIKDFAERGNAILWQMEDGIEEKVFADFFDLNRELIAKVVSALGINLDSLQSKLSNAQSETSKEQ